jgi:hypothetical protein
VDTPAPIGAGQEPEAVEPAARLTSEDWVNEGKSPMDLMRERVEVLAVELARTVWEESRLQDFAPSDVPKVIAFWAKDHNEDEGMLREAFIAALDKYDFSEGLKAKIIRFANGGDGDAPSETGISRSSPEWEEKVREAARAGAEIRYIAINPVLSKAEREGLAVATISGPDGQTIFMHSKDDVDMAVYIMKDERSSMFEAFDPSMIKMPTVAQLGLTKAMGWKVLVEDDKATLAQGWSNGAVLDIKQRPAMIQKAADKLGGLEGLPAPRVPVSQIDRVMSVPRREAKTEVEPLATTNNGKWLVLAGEGDVSMSVQTIFYGYFAKTYKGAKFYGSRIEGAPILVKHAGEVVGCMMPIKDNGADTLLKARRATKPAEAPAEPEQGPESGEAVNLIKVVDDAYAFTQATDRFKEYIADTVAETEYSMFLTAKAMDEAAKALGATISWDIEDAVMDSVLDDAQGPGLFDAVESDDEPEDEEGEDFDPEAEFDACPSLDDLGAC